MQETEDGRWKWIPAGSVQSWWFENGHLCNRLAIWVKWLKQSPGTWSSLQGRDPGTQRLSHVHPVLAAKCNIVHLLPLKIIANLHYSWSLHSDPVLAFCVLLDILKLFFVNNYSSRQDKPGVFITYYCSYTLWGRHSNLHQCSPDRWDEGD